MLLRLTGTKLRIQLWSCDIQPIISQAAILVDTKINAAVYIFAKVFWLVVGENLKSADVCTHIYLQFFVSCSVKSTIKTREQFDYRLMDAIF